MKAADTTADGGHRFGGQRFVILLYLVLVSIAALMGVLFTVAVDDPSPPALFFLFELPPTALGFGLYGGITIAVVLGIPLLIVVAVSEVVDDVDAVGRAEVSEGDETAVESVEPPKD